MVQTTSMSSFLGFMHGLGCKKPTPTVHGPTNQVWKATLPLPVRPPPRLHPFAPIPRRLSSPTHQGGLLLAWLGPRLPWPPGALPSSPATPARASSASSSAPPPVPRRPPNPCLLLLCPSLRFAPLRVHGSICSPQSTHPCIGPGAGSVYLAGGDERRRGQPAAAAAACYVLCVCSISCLFTFFVHR